MTHAPIRQIVFIHQNRAKLITEDPADTPDATGAVTEAAAVTVETEYTLISPGTELAWFSGMQRDVSGDAFHYPVYSGYCHSGTVTAVGEKVPPEAGIRLGNRVVTGAPHVSRTTVSLARELEVRHSDLRKPLAVVPPEISPELAPFAKVGEIAMTALRIADFSLGERVLVLGQGLVGNLAAQLFQLAGADVLAADLSAFRLERSRACGIRRQVNPSWEDLAAAVADWTGGRGADISVDSTGLSSVLLESLDYTRRLGELILLGTPRTAEELNPTPELWKAHMKGITLRGALRCLFYPLEESALSRRSVRRDLEEVLRRMAEGSLSMAPLHTHSYRPEQCQEAYTELLGARDSVLGALFDWRSHG